MRTKDGQNVRLTLDEARDLHAQLAELFAPRNAPAQPRTIIFERDRWPAQRQPYTPMEVSQASGDPLPQPPYIVYSSPSGRYEDKLRRFRAGYVKKRTKKTSRSERIAA